MKTGRISIFSKAMYSVLLALVACVMVIEISNLHVINRNKERADELYEHSMDYYCGFWEERLSMLNRSIITLMGHESGEYFNLLCDSDQSLAVEVSKVELLRKMNEIAEHNESQVMLFIHVPEHNIWISSEMVWGYETQLKINGCVKEYIRNAVIKNDNQWEILLVDDKPYLMKVYHMGNGYAGSLLSCEQIVDGLWGNQENADAVEMQDYEGNIIARRGEKFENTAVLKFEKNLGYTNIRLVALMTDSKLYSNKAYVLILTLCAVLLSLAIIIAVLEVQRRCIFHPLEELRAAMEKFSKGDMQVRLPVYRGNQEIADLHSTFNRMAEQIANLKIEVYEAELEKREVQSNYLKIQIQPHFYANILNLIYGLAQIKDYESIQKLSQVTAGYFRYLLGEKGTFVLLEEEIRCVRNYIDIQKFRYGDCLDISLEVQGEAWEQLILPLLIQTFVENSVKHNVTLVPVLKVAVSIKVEEEKLIITVKDNGIGFEKGVLDKLSRGEKISRDGKSIGIINVRERIRTFYQRDADIHIDSEPGNTTVTVVLPEVIGGKNQ